MRKKRATAKHMNSLLFSRKWNSTPVDKIEQANELNMVIDAWAHLPAAVRAGIVAMVRSLRGEEGR